MSTPTDRPEPQDRAKLILGASLLATILTWGATIVLGILIATNRLHGPYVDLAMVAASLLSLITYHQWRDSNAHQRSRNILYRAGQIHAGTRTHLGDEFRKAATEIHTDLLRITARIRDEHREALERVEARLTSNHNALGKVLADLAARILELRAEITANTKAVAARLDEVTTTLAAQAALIETLLQHQKEDRAVLDRIDAKMSTHANQHAADRATLDQLGRAAEVTTTRIGELRAGITDLAAAVNDRVGAVETWKPTVDDRLVAIGAHVATVAEQYVAVGTTVATVQDDYDRVKRHLEAVIEAVPALTRTAAVELVAGRDAVLDQRLTALHEKVGPGYAALRREGWTALKQHARAVHKRVTEVEARQAATDTRVATQDRAYGQRFQAFEGQVTTLAHNVDVRLGEVQASARSVLSQASERLDQVQQAAERIEAVADVVEKAAEARALAEVRDITKRLVPPTGGNGQLRAVPRSDQAED